MYSLVIVIVSFVFELVFGSIIDGSPLGIGLSKSCSVTGLDGNIYIFGGVDFGGTTDFTILYDPIGNRYSSLSPMMVPTRDACCLTHPTNGNIYVIGGSSDDKSRQRYFVQIYNPQKDNWTMGQNITGNGMGTICTIDIKTSEIHVFRETHQVYETATDHWRVSSQPLHNNREFGGVIQAMDGKFYLFGGKTAALDVFDPMTETWTKRNGMPYESIKFNSFYHQGKIYVFGGSSPYDNSNYDTIAVYSMALDRWNLEGDTLPRPIKSSAASVSRNQIHFFGGEGEAGPNIHWIDLCRFCSTECEERTACKKSSSNIEVILFALFLLVEFTAFCLLDKWNNSQKDKH